MMMVYNLWFHKNNDKHKDNAQGDYYGTFSTVKLARKEITILQKSDIVNLDAGQFDIQSQPVRTE